MLHGERYGAYAAAPQPCEEGAAACAGEAVPSARGNTLTPLRLARTIGPWAWRRTVRASAWRGATRSLDGPHPPGPTHGQTWAACLAQPAAETRLCPRATLRRVCARGGRSVYG